MAKSVIIGRVSVKVWPDTRGFARDAKAGLLKEEKRLYKPKAKVVAELDRSSLAATRAQLKAFGKSLSSQKVDIGTQLNGTEKAAAQLAVLTRPRKVGINVDINSGSIASAVAALSALSGLRLASETVESLGNAFKNIDRNLPAIFNATVAVIGLSAAFIALVGNVIGVAGGLVQIANLGLVLPALLIGVGAAVIGLAVPLAEINERIPEFADGFSTIADIMRENFWAVALEPMREMATTLLPQIAEGYSFLSTTLGQTAALMADAFTQATDGIIVPMFQNLDLAIQNMQPGLVAMTQAFVTLGQVGSTYLPGLGQSISNVSERFNEWVQTSEESGRLNELINEGIAAWDSFYSIIVSTSEILNGMFTAALAGGSTSIHDLAAGMENISAVVNGAGFQESMTGVFQAANTAMTNIGQESGPAVAAMFQSLADTAQQVFPQIGTVIGILIADIANIFGSPEVQQGVINMVDSISAVVGQLEGQLQPVAGFLGEFATTLGVAFEGLLPVVVGVVGSLAGVFAQILPALNPIIEILSGVLLQAFETLRPAIDNIGAAIVPLIAFVQEVLTAIQPLVDMLFELIGSILEPITAALEPIMASLSEALMPAIEQLVTALTPIMELLQQVVDFLMPIIVPVITFIAELLIGTLATAISGFADIFTGVWEIITGVWDAFAAFFTGDMAGWGEAIKQVWNGIWNVIKGVFKVVISIGILGVLRKGLALIKSLWRVTWNGIKTLFSTIWNGIKSFFSKIWDNLTAIVKAGLSVARQAVKNVMDKIKSIWSSVWGAISTFVIGLWTLINDYIRQKITDIRVKIFNWLNKLREKFRDTWNNIKEKVVNFVARLIIGFRELRERAQEIFDRIKEKIRAAIDKVKETFDNLRNKVQEVWDNVKQKITDAVDKVKTTITDMKDRAKEVFNKMVEIIRDKVEEVIEKFTNLKDDVKEKFSNAISLLKQAGKDIIQGLIDGLKSMVTKVKNAAKDVADAIWNKIKDTLSIFSPSREMAKLGRFAVEGLIVGMEDMRPKVDRTISSIGETFLDADFELGGLGRLSAQVNAEVGGAYAPKQERHLHYYAAPGSSIDAEEDLFKATERATRYRW